jgi:hypothetical protein
LQPRVPVPLEVHDMDRLDHGRRSLKGRCTRCTEPGTTPKARLWSHRDRARVCLRAVHPSRSRRDAPINRA